MECGFACDGEIVTKSRRKTIRSTAEPKFQKGIFRGTRCNCWKAPGFVDIAGAVGSQHEDNRFMQRRVGKVVAVFTLAGAASGAPTAEKPKRAEDVNIAKPIHK
jgi:hypothetical protein